MFSNSSRSVEKGLFASFSVFSVHESGFTPLRKPKKSSKLPLFPSFLNLKTQPKDTKTKDEIVKDVSAMANSAVGTIIYGIAESNGPSTNDSCADRLDPVERAKFSADTLDQVIQSIQPRIDGVRITTVDDPDQEGYAYYVVSIPQSTTAHQARDKRYYKRSNATTIYMDDKLSQLRTADKVTS